MLADNRIGELHTSWDMQLVNLELQDLELDDFDIGELNFGLVDDGMGWEADESKISDDVHLDGILSKLVIECDQESAGKIKDVCFQAIKDSGITEFTIEG